MTLLSVCVCVADVIPPGAAAAGFTKCVVDERPRAKDISPDGAGAHKWYSGQWYAKPPPLSLYSDGEDALVVDFGGDLTTAPRRWPEAGLIPFLPGKDGFYVEFECRISANDPDFFPAVWMMPAEKRAGHKVVAPGDPPEFERWMELDVDEGAFGPGTTSTVHNWWGKWPEYRHLQNPNNVSKQPLDRTAWHTFGASFEPDVWRVTWWLDGKMVCSAAAPYVPPIAKDLSYYFIVGAQPGRQKKPYKLFLRAVRAYAPQSSALPAVGVR